MSLVAGLLTRSGSGASSFIFFSNGCPSAFKSKTIVVFEPAILNKHRMGITAMFVKARDQGENGIKATIL